MSCKNSCLPQSFRGKTLWPNKPAQLPVSRNVSYGLIRCAPLAAKKPDTSSDSSSFPPLSYLAQAPAIGLKRTPKPPNLQTRRHGLGSFVNLPLCPRIARVATTNLCYYDSNHSIKKKPSGRRVVDEACRKLGQRE